MIYGDYFGILNIDNKDLVSVFGKDLDIWDEFDNV